MRCVCGLIQIFYLLKGFWVSMVFIQIQILSEAKHAIGPSSPSLLLSAALPCPRLDWPGVVVSDICFADHPSHLKERQQGTSSSSSPSDNKNTSAHYLLHSIHPSIRLRPVVPLPQRPISLEIIPFFVYPTRHFRVSKHYHELHDHHHCHRCVRR